MKHAQEHHEPEDDSTPIKVGTLTNINTLIGKRVVFNFPRSKIGPYTVREIRELTGYWELTVEERPQKIHTTPETEIEIL